MYLSNRRYWREIIITKTMPWSIPPRDPAFLSISVNALYDDARTKQGISAIFSPKRWFRFIDKNVLNHSMPVYRMQLNSTGLRQFCDNCVTIEMFHVPDSWLVYYIISWRSSLPASATQVCLGERGWLIKQRQNSPLRI